MTLCAFIKQGGVRCGGTAMQGYDTCYGHRTDLAEERRRNASKGGKRGGRGRPQAELSGIKARLSTLADDVLGGLVDRGDAAVVSQILNTYLRGLEIERRTFDMSSLLERLDLLEEQAERLRGA